MSSRPRILVTNDDGITAPGIQALIEVARTFGEVTVVAPDSPQSGMGHAISIGRPLRLYEQDLPIGGTGWACSGTPADCVKLARAELFHQKPDLVLSGINHGANASISVLYSGTMSAAVEAAIENVPSIGFSLCSFDHHADFSLAKQVAERVIRAALAHPFPAHTALNVNVPAISVTDFKGIRPSRQSLGRFIEEFDRRTDPFNRPYYWLTGRFMLEDAGEDTDSWALDNGYASICPVQIDMTAHRLLSELAQWQLS
jgi:5'-nucleotidase